MTKIQIKSKIFVHLAGFLSFLITKEGEKDYPKGVRLLGQHKNILQQSVRLLGQRKKALQISVRLLGQHKIVL